MKRYILIILLIISFFYQTYALDIFNTNTRVMYCNDNNECWLEQWSNAVKGELNWVNTDIKASDYIQNLVLYLLSFVTLIWILYIIYAWFKHLISWWDEEKASDTKKIILSVFIWLIIIWLSYAIVWFFMDILWAWSWWGTTTTTSP